MLTNVQQITGFTLDSLDGEIGTVNEFYFDDKHWTIRYMVADTGSWLPGRLVLISPRALVEVSNEKKQVAVNLTKEQIEGSPSPDSDKPVSRQFEEAYYGYYQWPNYWEGPYVWGFSPNFIGAAEEGTVHPEGEKNWDSHLRSTREVQGYHVQGRDGEIGHVEDFIIDDATWSIRYLVVETGSWWAGKKVLVSTQWVDGVSWNESKVMVNLSRESIEQSPAYTQEALLTREYEDQLHRHYQRNGYWE